MELFGSKQFFFCVQMQKSELWLCKIDYENLRDGNCTHQNLLTQGITCMKIASQWHVSRYSFAL